jgi:type IV pilus assembly protein PilX
MIPNQQLFIGKRHISSPQKQRGIVLLITLIVLVAMMLAGIGMMRSTDTVTKIAGNLSFRESALHGGDAGIYNGYNQLLTMLANNKAALGADSAFPGYFASPFNDCEVLNTCLGNERQWWNTNVTFPADYWSNNRSGTPAPTINVTDTSGKTVATVSYMVQRMCTSSAPVVCQTYSDTSTRGNALTGDQTTITSTAVFYRITAKSLGPRNTVVYSQALALLPE